MKGCYYVRDQTRQGCSYKGKRAGEVDILIRVGKIPISIIEALKLTSVDEKYISTHIDKIYKYDTLGYKYNFIVSYVNSKDFNEFFKRYYKYVCLYRYPYDMIDNKVDISRQYPELRTIEVRLNRCGIYTKLYHILVHISN